MLTRRRTTTIGGVLAVSLALGACGSSSSDKVSAGTYVKSVCQAVGPFEKDVQSRSSALNLQTIKSPQDGKKALQGFLSAVSADTDKAVSQLKAAKAPDVKNGQKISTAIVGAFTQLRSALGTADTSAQNLPTNSAAAFKTAAESLGNTVKNSMNNIGSGLNGLTSPDLESAAKKEPACTSLSAS
jgi:Flp pilus assembly pilin Flp